MGASSPSDKPLNETSSASTQMLLMTASASTRSLHADSLSDLISVFNVGRSRAAVALNCRIKTGARLGSSFSNRRRPKVISSPVRSRSRFPSMGRALSRSSASGGSSTVLPLPMMMTDWLTFPPMEISPLASRCLSSSMSSSEAVLLRRAWREWAEFMMIFYLWY